MAKSLVLTTSEQSLEALNLPVRSDFTVNFYGGSSERYVIETNNITEQRALVPFANLLTFNGLPVYSSNNAVLED